MLSKKQQEHQRYLQSGYWRQRRLQRLEVAGHRCEFRPELDWDPKYGSRHGDRCTNTDLLDVHHVHYESLGAEKDSDLEVLCRFHHLVRHTAGQFDCAGCGDDSYVVEEYEAIEAVKNAIKERNGDVRVVHLSDIDAYGSCSFCDR